MLKRIITNKLKKWGFVQDIPDEIKNLRKDMENLRQDVSRDKHDIKLDNNKTTHDIEILNRASENRIQKMLEEQDVKLLGLEQTIKTTTSDMRATNKETDKKIETVELHIRQAEQRSNQHCDEIVNDLRRDVATFNRSQEDKNKKYLEQLITMRKQIVMFENSVTDFKSLPTDFRDLLSNLEGYKKSIDKTVKGMVDTVATNKEKVDRFDATYYSMLRGGNKNAGRMNTQSWE